MVVLPMASTENNLTRISVLKLSDLQHQTTDKEALQLSSKILHVVSSDLKSHKQGIRKYAYSVIRRAELGEPDVNS